MKFFAYASLLATTAFALGNVPIGSSCVTSNGKDNCAFGGICYKSPIEKLKMVTSRKAARVKTGTCITRVLLGQECQGTPNDRCSRDSECKKESIFAKTGTCKLKKTGLNKRCGVLDEDEPTVNVQCKDGLACIITFEKSGHCIKPSSIDLNFNPTSDASVESDNVFAISPPLNPIDEGEELPSSPPVPQTQKSQPSAETHAETHDETHAETHAETSSTQQKTQASASRHRYNPNDINPDNDEKGFTPADDAYNFIIHEWNFLPKPTNRDDQSAQALTVIQPRIALSANGEYKLVVTENGQRVLSDPLSPELFIARIFTSSGHFLVHGAEFARWVSKAGTGSRGPPIEASLEVSKTLANALVLAEAKVLTPIQNLNSELVASVLRETQRIADQNKATGLLPPSVDSDDEE